MAVLGGRVRKFIILGGRKGGRVSGVGWKGRGMWSGEV